MDSGTNGGNILFSRGLHMRCNSDPTASAASSAIEKEYQIKKKIAKKLRILLLKGELTDELIDKATRRFSGIFSPLHAEVFKD
jgi:hypothetical protein